MAHYAFLDQNNIVTEVIAGRDEDEVVDGISDWEAFYGELRGQRCLRTSYTGKIRGQFAGVGFLYDSARDVFIAPQVFPSWVLNEDTLNWEPPIPYPDDGQGYGWDEDIRDWVLIDIEELPEG